MATDTDLTSPRTIEGITRPDHLGHHYGQIIAWVICWPWNLLWILVVHNPFRYICEFALHEIQSTLDEIATGEFSEITRDLEERAPRATAPPVVASPTPPAYAAPVLPQTTNSNWMEPAREQESSPIETAAEASSPSDTGPPELPVEEAASCEESAAWPTPLKADSATAVTSTADSAETYKAPVLPPTFEPDPLHYTPNRRPHEAGTSGAN
jgi:hypothetical protein